MYFVKIIRNINYVINIGISKYYLNFIFSHANEKSYDDFNTFPLTFK